jgi:hypothetical protein
VQQKDRGDSREGVYELQPKEQLQLPNDCVYAFLPHQQILDSTQGCKSDIHMCCIGRRIVC